MTTSIGHRKCSRSLLIHVGMVYASCLINAEPPWASVGIAVMTSVCYTAERGPLRYGALRASARASARASVGRDDKMVSPRLSCD